MNSNPFDSLGYFIGRCDGSSAYFMNQFGEICMLYGIDDDRRKVFIFKTRLRALAYDWFRSTYDNKKGLKFEKLKKEFLKRFSHDWYYEENEEEVIELPKVEKLLKCDDVVKQQTQLILDSEAEVTALSPECETQKEIDLSGDKSELEVVECLSEVEKVNTENFTVDLLKENDKNLETQSDNNCSNIESRDELFSGYLPVIKGENHTPETVIERNGKENIDCQLTNEIEIGYSKCNKTRLCYNIITVPNKIYCTFHFCS